MYIPLELSTFLFKKKLLAISQDFKILIFFVHFTFYLPVFPLRKGHKTKGLE